MFLSNFSGFNPDLQMRGMMGAPQKFEEFFRCYPISKMPGGDRKDAANFGGKIYLPPSALNKLSMLHIRYPMLFELVNTGKGLKTFSGVLEFTAEEGRVYLPQWMMRTLKLETGAVVKIANADISKGTYVKIEPQSVDFYDISDPRAVLENVLRNFSTLTVNDVIEFKYNNKIHGIKVLEVKPESSFNSVCVIETNLETDFAPAVGYVEPDYSALKAAKEKKKQDPTRTLGTMAKSIEFAKLTNSANEKLASFQGEGHKLSTKGVSKSKKADLGNIKIDLNAPPAPLDLPDGQLFFGFPVVAPKAEGVEEKGESESANGVFSGQGQTLRSKKRKDHKGHECPKPKVHSPEVIEIDD